MKNFLLLIALVFTSLNANANTSHDAPEIKQSWARSTPPGTTTSAIYMTIVNHSKDILKLVAVKSDFTDRIELHNTKMKDGMMQMRQIDNIELEKMATVELKPHGMHLMLFDLKEPLIEGSTVEIQLIFDDGNTVLAEVPVMKQTGNQDHSNMQSKKHKKH